MERRTVPAKPKELKTAQHEPGDVWPITGRRQSWAFGSTQCDVSMGQWDVLLERARTHRFSVSAMAFQDVWNLDLERLRDCCIHVVHGRQAGAFLRLQPDQHRRTSALSREIVLHAEDTAGKLDFGEYWQRPGTN